jgi:hypothetical protein
LNWPACGFGVSTQTAAALIMRPATDLARSRDSGMAAGKIRQEDLCSSGGWRYQSVSPKGNAWRSGLIVGQSASFMMERQSRRAHIK